MSDLREEIEMMKFNCPTCPLPHNLSSKEIDRLLSLLLSFLLEKLPKEEKPKEVKLELTETALSASVRAIEFHARNQALREVRLIISELLGGKE